jgi:hypothetical protein
MNKNFALSICTLCLNVGAFAGLFLLGWPMGVLIGAGVGLGVGAVVATVGAASGAPDSAEYTPNQKKIASGPGHGLVEPEIDGQGDRFQSYVTNREASGERFR